MVGGRHLARSASGALLAATFLVVCLVLAASVPAYGLDDGVYQVDAHVSRAASDDASVADAAFEKPLMLIVKGDSSYLVVSIKPVTTAGLTGYLGFLGYYPSYHGKSAPKSDEFTEAIPQGYYEAVDDFNAPDGSDAAMRGMKYPQRAVLEVDPSYAEVWIQVYVPLVEGLSAGGGTQRARLVIDYGSARAVEDAPAASVAMATAESYERMDAAGYTMLYGQIYQASMRLLQANTYTAASLQRLREARDAANAVCEDGAANTLSGKSVAASLLQLVNAQQQLQKNANGSKDNGAGTEGKDGSSQKKQRKTQGTREASAASAKLDFAKLPDGIYTIYGEMIKTDRKSTSVSNDAIDHNVRIRVKNGRYTVVLTFKSIELAGKKGALGKLWYFKSGYGRDSSGAPQGAFARGKVLSRLSLGDGETYPKKVSFPLISEARADGWVPLRVYVPVIESISKGAGVQEVYLRLDKSTLVGGKRTVSANTVAAAGASQMVAEKTGSEGSGDEASEIDALLDGAAESDEGASAKAKPARASSVSAASAPVEGAGTVAETEDREPPLKRYIGLIVGVPALIVFLYCAYVLFTRRGQVRILRRSRP